MSPHNSPSEVQISDLNQHRGRLRSRDVKSYRPWRIIPEIDKNPQLIALAQTLVGRILLLICFAIVIRALGQSPLVAALAGACAYGGRYRWHLIPFATLIVAYQNGFWIDERLVAKVADQEGIASIVDIPFLYLGMLAVVLLLSSCLIHFWSRIIRVVPLFRRSTVALILCFVSLVLVGESPICQGEARVLLWIFLITFLPYLWFLAYALTDAGSGERRPFWQYLGLFHPFWASTLTPFGKGAAYLQKFEAKTPGDLAITQLKGLKLAIWVGVLWILHNILGLLVHDYLEVPRYDDTFAAYLIGNPYPWYTCWAGMVSFFFEDLLQMSAVGGVFVACARMAGFRLLRNTYRPLGATSIAEFWNRYYFYYKELLVDQFFYPTFFRCFRKHRRLRVFCATFVAACIGNLLFHFLRDIRFIPELGLLRALAGEQSHAFYTFVLALGIAFSQVRLRPTGLSRGWLRDRLLPFIRVALFFCVLHVFDAPLDREHTIWQHGRFLLYLVGLDTWI